MTVTGVTVAVPTGLAHTCPTGRPGEVCRRLVTDTLTGTRPVYGCETCGARWTVIDGKDTT